MGIKPLPWSERFFNTHLAVLRYAPGLDMGRGGLSKTAAAVQTVGSDVGYGPQAKGSLYTIQFLMRQPDKLNYRGVAGNGPGLLQGDEV